MSTQFPKLNASKERGKREPRMAKANQAGNGMNKVAYTDRYAKYGTYAQETRITRNNLATLRAKDPEEHATRKFFVNLMTELQHLFGGLLVAAPKKNNSMCKYYGHVIKGKWASELPHCADCGHLIHSPEELRKAAAR
jgi:hypothetical protein